METVYIVKHQQTNKTIVTRKNKSIWNDGQKGDDISEGVWRGMWYGGEAEREETVKMCGRWLRKQKISMGRLTKWMGSEVIQLIAATRLNYCFSSHS